MRLKAVRLSVAICLAFFSLLGACHGIIIYGRDNSGNQTNPGISGAWDSVVTLAQPAQSYNASGVYVGNGYFLTAGHVDAVQIGQQVKINGTLYSLDTSFDTDGILYVKDIAGVDDEVDLKIFRVLSPPLLSSAILNSNAVNAGRKRRGQRHGGFLPRLELGGRKRDPGEALGDQLYTECH